MYSATVCATKQIAKVAENIVRKFSVFLRIHHRPSKIMSVRKSALIIVNFHKVFPQQPRVLLQKLFITNESSGAGSSSVSLIWFREFFFNFTPTLSFYAFYYIQFCVIFCDLGILLGGRIYGIFLEANSLLHVWRELWFGKLFW